MGYGDWNSFSLSDQLQSMLYGLLTLLGFETPTPLMGVQGILNALILLMPAACAVVLLRRSRDDAQTESVRLCRLSLVLGFALSAVVFLLIRSVYLERYWLPLLMLGAPVMADCLTHEKDGILRAAVIALLAGTVLLTSASCIYYSAKNPQVQTDMRMEAVDLIRRMGLDKGYATFWNANIITELSDGEIDVVSLIARTEQDGSVSFHLNPWLETDEELSITITSSMPWCWSSSCCWAHGSEMAATPFCKRRRPSIMSWTVGLICMRSPRSGCCLKPSAHCKTHLPPQGCKSSCLQSCFYVPVLPFSNQMNLREAKKGV